MLALRMHCVVYKENIQRRSIMFACHLGADNYLPDMKIMTWKSCLCNKLIVYEV